MRDFIDRSACNGYSPRLTHGGNSVFRSALTSKLLRERHVPRYIVAPTGYGKTMLALQYAETVFSFQNVYWIDCQSPCFLRDLDANLIADRLCAKEETASLVVFDDVPMLDTYRTSIFMKQIDCILEQGGEVLVACTPSCDSFSHQRDRMKIGPWDMLLTDEELRETRTLLECESRVFVSDSPWQRIPQLVWGEGANTGSYLIESLREELPDDMRTCVFVMMVLGAGTLAEVSAFVRLKPDSLYLLERDYPHLGISQELGTFHCLRVPLEVSDVIPGKIMSSVADGSCFSSKEGLSAALADMLIKRGELERACSLMECVPNVAARVSWLIHQSDQLLQGGCLSPASALFARCAVNDRNVTATLCSGELLRQLLLENNKESLALADRILRKVEVTELERALAAFAFLRFADGVLPEHVRIAVNMVMSGQPVVEQIESYVPPGSSMSEERYLLHIAQTSCLDMKAAVDMQYQWLLQSSSPVSFISAWLLMKNVSNLFNRETDNDGFNIELGQSLTRLGLRIEQICSQDSVSRMSLPAALVISEYMRLFQRGLSFESCFGDELCNLAGKMEMDLFRQQRASRTRLLTQQSLQKSSTPREKMLALEKQSVLVDSVHPQLRVNLFGGMDVFLGSERLNPALFSRSKVRTLLALLVLNGGKEYSSERLIQLMWPGKSPKAGRNNLYVVWGELRRALELPDKTCPYLIKQQQGLRIDSNLLVSDIRRFNEICRILLFENPSYGGWVHVHDQVTSDFLEDLLPSEDKNDYIANLRVSYRNRLVDGLVSASRRLADTGDNRNAVWFAQTAVMRAKTREDAYCALMYAQLASGQRTAALDTYFECSRVLSDELGIDPSAEVMRLYKAALDSE